MGIRLHVHKTANDQRYEQDFDFQFDEGMTILQVKKIIEKIQYRLVNSERYIFRITADEVISENEEAKKMTEKVVIE